MGKAILSVREVACQFATPSGKMQALRPVSFDVDEGAFLSIVGPSGCGKTTLLRILAGLLAASEGHVQIEGREVRGPTLGLGIVYQRPVLLPWRTVLQNVLLAAEIQPMDADRPIDRARELLNRVGLSGFENAYPSHLSGGMQQRVSLCRALLPNPKLLLMDEPFAALDAMTRERMGLLLHNFLRGQGKSVVFITHGIPEAVFLSTDVIVMTGRPGAIGARFSIDLPDERDLSLLAEPRFTSQSQQIREAVLQYAGEF